MGYSPWGRKESDTTEQLTLSLFSQVRKLRHEDEPALPHPTPGHLASGRDRIRSQRCDPWYLFLDTLEAAWSPRWDSCPPSPATWEGTKGGRVYLSLSFPKRVLGQIPSPFCGPCSSPTPKFWATRQVGNKPLKGRLPEPTVIPLGTDQGPAALSEALPVLMLQKGAAGLLASAAIP